MLLIESETNFSLIQNQFSTIRIIIFHSYFLKSIKFQDLSCPQQKSVKIESDELFIFFVKEKSMLNNQERELKVLLTSEQYEKLLNSYDFNSQSYRRIPIMILQMKN